MGGELEWSSRSNDPVHAVVVSSLWLFAHFAPMIARYRIRNCEVGRMCACCFLQSMHQAIRQSLIRDIEHWLGTATVHLFSRWSVECFEARGQRRVWSIVLNNYHLRHHFQTPPLLTISMPASKRVLQVVAFDLMLGTGVGEGRDP